MLPFGKYLRSRLLGTCCSTFRAELRVRKAEKRNARERVKERDAPGCKLQGFNERLV